MSIGTKGSHGTKKLYWLANDAVGVAWVAWVAWWFWLGAQTREGGGNDATQATVGQENKEITSPFLATSYCIVCQPARWFLYHATVSYKGPLASGTGILASFRVRLGQ